MARNEQFLTTARSLTPPLHVRRVSPVRAEYGGALKRGDAVRYDFGTHLVGHVTIRLGSRGSHPDAPAWIRLSFAERLCELSEHAEEYHGWISTGWIQQEQIHVDVLPAMISLPRRYAFRYLQVEVLDVSGKYDLTVEEVWCDASTSADDAALVPYQGAYPELDRAACLTLSECMQEVFEDGPKRDRRLWIGDLRLQARANYVTFRNDDLVRRCLYLFAGCTMEDGRISQCVFTGPEVCADDSAMFDYSLLFIPTLLDYLTATGDEKTARELWPTACAQIEAAARYFDGNDLVRDSDVLGWCFLDWNLNLNKQAGAQGCYLYCVRAAAELAGRLDETEMFECLTEDYARKKAAARQLWDERQQVFVSGDARQISWASQVWMILGGAVDPEEGAVLLNRMEELEALPALHGALAGADRRERIGDMETTAIERMVTPYMMHHYIDALIAVGCEEKAKTVMADYWSGMLDAGADTFWEMYDPADPDASPYGGTIVNSYCHAWSCGPAWFLRKYGW